jgi:predicted aspartyl protease
LSNACKIKRSGEKTRNPKPYHSLTVTSRGGLLNTISSPVKIAQARSISGLATVDMPEFTSVWDTGATGTVVSPEVVRTCDLKQTGTTYVKTANDEMLTNVYLVDVWLPNGVMFYNMKATEGKLPDGLGVLIGMDIITCGDFSITNVNKTTVMSFRVPSIECIDYSK